MLEAVKQWAFTLVITAAIGGIANYFVISSENGGMKRYVKFACAAVALAVMIMPIREIFREAPRLIDFNFSAYEIEAAAYSNEYTDQINLLTIAKTNELIKHRISDIVYEKTGIKPDDVYIYMNYTDNSQTEIEIEKIIIYMIYRQENEEVKIYLERLFDCEVEINER